MFHDNNIFYLDIYGLVINASAKILVAKRLYPYDLAPIPASFYFILCSTFHFLYQGTKSNQLSIDVGRRGSQVQFYRDAQQHRSSPYKPPLVGLFRT